MIQTSIIRKRYYHINNIDQTEYSQPVYERLEKIRLFDELRSEGCSIAIACKSLKVPIATLYRWKKNYKALGLVGLENEDRRPRTTRTTQWNQNVVRKVLNLRKQNPLYGKNKITVLLKRDHRIKVSVSTVGRIIVYLIERNQVKPVPFYYKKKRVRARIFNNHAQRWKRDMKPQVPGDLFQIDHMSVTVVAGHAVKHFQGICPITKMVVEQAYSSATSNVAKQFLEHVQANLPFKLRSIQVDGGSEFMKEFEQACKNANIALYVLPPKSPEYNGNVERANGAAKYEFYMFYEGKLDLFSIRNALDRYVKKYNTYRPHQALQYLTPWQYYSKNFAEA